MMKKLGFLFCTEIMAKRDWEKKGNPNPNPNLRMGNLGKMAGRNDDKVSIFASFFLFGCPYVYIYIRICVVALFF